MNTPKQPILDPSLQPLCDYLDTRLNALETQLAENANLLRALKKQLDSVPGTLKTCQELIGSMGTELRQLKAERRALIESLNARSQASQRQSSNRSNPP